MFLVENSPQKVSIDKQTDTPHPKQINNLTVFKHECVSFLCVLYQKLLQLNLNEKKNKPFQYQKNFVFRKDAYLVCLFLSNYTFDNQFSLNPIHILIYIILVLSQNVSQLLHHMYSVHGTVNDLRSNSIVFCLLS